MVVPHGIYLHVLRIVPELYAVRGVHEYLHAAVRLVASALSCDGCAWFVYAFGKVPRLVTLVENEPIITPALAEELRTTAESSPFPAVWRDRGPRTVIPADVPRRAWTRHVDENRSLYNEIGRSVMSIPIDIAATGVAAMSVRRSRRPFTEDERLLAELLRPHLRQSYVNAQVYSSLCDVGSPPAVLTATLTPREAQVAGWLAKAKTNVEIAVILNSSPRTIEKHVESVLRKLQVENRTAAALLLNRREALLSESVAAPVPPKVPARGRGSAR